MLIYHPSCGLSACSRELVGSRKAWNRYLKLKQLLTSNRIHTVKQRLSGECRKDISVRGSSMMMFASSTAESIEEEWILSLGVSHVRTSAKPDGVREYREETGRACGLKCLESLAKYAPELFSWRTRQKSLDGGLTKSLGVFPKSGMTQFGQLYRLGIVGPHMGVKGGSALPTNKRKKYPTLTCSDAFTDMLQSSQQKPGSKHSISLAQMMRKKYATPCARDCRVGSKSMLGKSHLDSEIEYSNRTQQIGENGVIMRLNPDWVEWIMGFPPFWTDIAKDVKKEFEYTHRVCDSKTPFRCQRLECLGNAVVPFQAATALTILLNILNENEI